MQLGRVAEEPRGEPAGTSLGAGGISITPATKDHSPQTNALFARTISQEKMWWTVHGPANPGYPWETKCSYVLWLKAFNVNSGDSVPAQNVATFWTRRAMRKAINACSKSPSNCSKAQANHFCSIVWP